MAVVLLVSSTEGRTLLREGEVEEEEEEEEEEEASDPLSESIFPPRDND